MRGDGRMGGDLRLDDDQMVCHSLARNLQRWSTAHPPTTKPANHIRMAPKRPNKRRSEDDGHGRHSKKGPGKNKREVTYDTYDEAMDGESAGSAQWSAEADGQAGWRWKRRASGIGMVTRWAPVDRCRAGAEEQAQRFYEKALDLYKKAYDFNPTYDAAYNQ